jgi:hypothetical protein
MALQSDSDRAVVWCVSVETGEERGRESKYQGELPWCVPLDSSWAHEVVGSGVSSELLSLVACYR